MIERNFIAKFICVTVYAALISWGFHWAVTPAHAGWRLIVRDQAVVQWVEVYGAGKTETILKPPAPPAYPVTANRMICRSAGFDLYSSNSARRTEVWEDATGTATDAEVLAACPTFKSGITDQIKEIRKQALARFAIDAGVLAVYDQNYQAAEAYKDGYGLTTIMRNGMTAEGYLAGMASQMGMTAAAFADYILAENRKTLSAYGIEREYLRLAYTGIPATSSIATLLAFPQQFKGFCGL